MLALKKKREAEQKAAADAAAAAPSVAPETAEQDATTTDTGNGSSNKVSLLGIGGVKKSNAATSNAQKKRTPGEIRIQKGGCCLRFYVFRNPPH
jgi:hypothetical protein